MAQHPTSSANEEDEPVAVVSKKRNPPNDCAKWLIGVPLRPIVAVQFVLFFRGAISGFVFFFG